MAPQFLSLESLLGDIQALDQLSPAARANGLASLVKQVHEAHETSTELRVMVQDTFCQALVKTLQPTKSAAALLTASTNGPSTQHSNHNKTASRNQQHLVTSLPTTAVADPDLAQAWTAASLALELIYSWEDEHVVVSVINFWSQISSLLCGSWLQQDQEQQLSHSQHTTPSHQPPTAAAAEDPSDYPSDPTNPSTTAAAAAAPQSSSTPELQYLTWLWALGPAAVTAVVQQLHQFWLITGINHLQHKHTQQQHNKGPAHHLINLLLLFLDLHNSLGNSSSSSSSSSCQAAVQLLQLLYGGGSASRPASVAAAITAGEAFAGVCCLLQAAAALHIALPAPRTPTPAAVRVVQDDQAAADRNTTSPPPPPAAAGADLEDFQPDANTSAITAWPMLAEAAGKWLRDCYGWCGFGEAANASPAAAAAAAEAARHSAAGFSSSSAATVARPSTVESLYDCFMMLLLQQMMQGPAAVVSSSSSSSAGNSGIMGRKATQHQAGSQAAAASVGDSAPGGTGGTAAVLSRDDWERWLDSEAFSALAALVATYDRPDVLARGLHMLTQRQLQAAENAVAAAAAAAADGAEAAAATAETQGLYSKTMQAAAKKAEKAAIRRVLQLLGRVFLWRQQQQALEAVLPDSDSSDDSTAAGGVCQLLLGLSELLRPAANCSVEWRCAALTAMLSAVEDFMQEHQDDSDLELQLWCDASVEGLLYCASHDPSIQARRAAVQLLQHVVLPNSSSTGRALIRCLADKLSDKDSGVAAAALQLFVQLPPKVLCGSLTAVQWCGAVQACLEMVCGSGDSADTATQGGRRMRGSKAQDRDAGAAARGQFVELLKTVLLSEASSDGQCQQQQQQQQLYGWEWLMSQGGRVVGVEGCKQVLLMLLMQPGLGDSWQALAEVV